MRAKSHLISSQPQYVHLVSSQPLVSETNQVHNIQDSYETSLHDACFGLTHLQIRPQPALDGKRVCWVLEGKDETHQKGGTGELKMADLSGGICFPMMAKSI